MPTHAFTFESVTVNARGELVARVTGRGTLLEERLGPDLALELVALPDGEFVMGSPPGQGYSDEHPAHPVRVAPFWLGRYPVTQAQWRAVLGRLPDCRCHGETRPVDRVSWRVAQRFCAQLAHRTGRAYRLPTEAEWEYACRAGTTTPFALGETLTTELANYVGNYTYRAEPKGVYRHESTPVGSFPPNAWGLCDLHGNVWEWCIDRWHPNYQGAPTDGRAWEAGQSPYRVLRGGCWHDPPDLCRSAARLKFGPAEGEDFVGLRVALSMTESTAARFDPAPD